MGIKDKYKVIPIPPEQTYEWTIRKHYAHRKPMAIEFSYGLYDTDMVTRGVCIFGPTSPTVPLTLFGEIGKHKVRELTRLVISGNMERGVLSFFVSQSIKLLPRPMCLISFADGNMGHHGYIYQATNWIYTGEGGELKEYTDKEGNIIHRITLVDRAQVLGLSPEEYIKEYGIKKEKVKPKHRYIYFVGSKREIKVMREDFKLISFPYPKGDNSRYNDDYKPSTQIAMF